MEYRDGFSIKPYRVTQSGAVFFTDGTTTETDEVFEFFPDQLSCEAYGYKYDSASGTCYAGKFNPQINRAFQNTTNLQRGNSNILSSDNTIVLGSNNSALGNRNAIIIGEGHTIEQNEDFTSSNNASILGGKGAAITREAEVAIGGGLHSPVSDGYISRRQRSFLALTGQTSDNTATKLTVQGDGSYINIKKNSVIGFDIYITRLELGGSSGTAGNYSYRNIRGAVRIDNSYTMAFVIAFTRNIAKIGVNGTCTMVDSTTGGVPSISVEVTDRNNVNNLWSATVSTHEVISTTTF